jgi:hypothetical protein
MTHGVRLYLVGSLVLVSLAGCGRGFFQSAEREPWRAEAEVACLKSGAVKESAELVRNRPDLRSRRVRRGISAESGGARRKHQQFRICRRKPSAARQYRQSAALADHARAGGGSDPRKLSRKLSGKLFRKLSGSPSESAPRQPAYAAPSNGPISLSAPGIAPQADDVDLPPEGGPQSRGGYLAAPGYPAREPYPAPSAPYSQPSYSPPPAATPAAPRLGPAQGNSVSAFGQVSMKPAATLACPIVSALDRWLSDSVQPAAMRWFGVRVVEIKQISAYSCRGMNGNPHAHISEHAFGNALDIAAFTLADGRASRSRAAGAACRKSRAFCATCRRPPASSSTPCWRRAPTPITRITSTST